jgi:AcrR family transcriptional regulator
MCQKQNLTQSAICVNIVKVNTAADRAAPNDRPTKGERRQADIRRAAIEQFTNRGIAATSMADIAEAAGVSRPALYQYYRDKDEIFAAALVGFFEDLVDNALSELAGPSPLAVRLDRFLQRFDGDLWERLASSSNLDEVSRAKSPQVSEAVGAVLARLDEGLAHHLADVVPGRGNKVQTQRAGWQQLLRLSPYGLRHDKPPVDEYRRRLTNLAKAAAADIDDHLNG